MIQYLSGGSEARPPTPPMTTNMASSLASEQEEPPEPHWSPQPGQGQMTVINDAVSFTMNIAIIYSYVKQIKCDLLVVPPPSAHSPTCSPFRDYYAQTHTEIPIYISGK